MMHADFTQRRETYNGWSNRETWALVLHMQNNEGLEQDIAHIVRDSDNLEDALKSVWQDILSASWWRLEMGCDMPEWAENAQNDIGSLWRVDWSQVAAAFRESM